MADRQKGKKGLTSKKLISRVYKSTCTNIHEFFTIKGGYRRAEKSRKVLMMTKAAKLDLAGPGAGQNQGRSGPGEKQEQSRSRGGVGQEQGRS